jgi:ubiquinone/menaquinone biosynthesis C-methylase UbiE
MNVSQAVELIEGAVPRTPGTWADLGCGDGTFTMALAERLGQAGRIYAVDRDSRALSRLKRRAAGQNVIPVLGDFTGSLSFPGHEGPFDGLLFANSLHYIPDPGRILARFKLALGPAGRIVVVEYDRRDANPWVPYPIPPARLETILAAAELSPPVITATYPSAFSGVLYAAVTRRPE